MLWAYNKPLFTLYSKNNPSDKHLNIRLSYFYLG